VAGAERLIGGGRGVALPPSVQLDPSPVDSIRDTEAISVVIHRGVPVDRTPPISR